LLNEEGRELIQMNIYSLSHIQMKTNTPYQPRLSCINCISDTIFHFGWIAGKGDFYPMNPDTAPYEEFLKDKKFVTELFHSVKQ